MQHEMPVFRSAAAIRKAWGLLLGLAGTALALSVLKDSYVDPGFAPIAYKSLLWCGLGLLALLSVCVIVDQAGWWIERDSADRFRPAKGAELDDILPLYDRVVGGTRPSLNELKALHSANSEIFTVLERRTKVASKTSTKIVGFCTLMPLNKEAKALLDREELNGLKMSPVHICRPRQRAACLYLGSIGAEGYRARGAILGYALGVMNESARKGVASVFTRPITADGLRAAKQHDFLPVANDVRKDELGRLYRLNLTAQRGV